MPSRPSSAFGEAPDLEDDLLRALRSSPDSSLSDLADAVGLPRTNFGRALSSRLRPPIRRLLDRGLIEEHHRRYRISENGRRVLADRAFDAPD